jgi:hypothetical protein
MGISLTELTFNYKLPCDIDETTAVAVVVQGVNRMDLLEENDEGEFVYARDTSKSLAWFSAISRSISALILSLNASALAT